MHDDAISLLLKVIKDATTMEKSSCYPAFLCPTKQFWSFRPQNWASRRENGVALSFFPTLIWISSGRACPSLKIMAVPMDCPDLYADS